MGYGQVCGAGLGLVIHETRSWWFIDGIQTWIANPCQIVVMMRDLRIIQIEGANCEAI